MAILEVEELTKFFGGIRAVWNCSFKVDRGDLVGIIGPNGSGKTTLINLITGFVKPDKGHVRINGKDVTGLEPHKIAELNIGRTFQLIRLFKDSTVWENMLIAARTKYRKVEEAEEKARELLKRINLYNLKDLRAESLSYGQQKLLEFARAIIREPDIIFLDEPTGGVNPVMIQQLTELIKRLNKEDCKTFVMIEHNMKFVRDICERVIVMNEGEIIAEGEPSEILLKREVIEAYLGRLVI